MVPVEITGTTVGCWRVERGQAGHDALESLKGLCATCRKSSRPSPDTREQAAFAKYELPVELQERFRYRRSLFDIAADPELARTMFGRCAAFARVRDLIGEKVKKLLNEF